ncbi:MAG TPA: sugar dehydratase [Clostridiales bacterium]|nr:sugar dehydratase [Clostridiales bacterium]
MGFWSGRPVLVTGGTGFVGSWLVKELVDRGADVVCLVRDHVPRCWLFLSGYLERVTSVRGCVEDYRTLERVLNEYEVETVFHLAAQTIVGTANRSPLATFEANVRGTYNLLEAARVHGRTVRRVVVASTDKVYGRHEDLPYTEDMPLRGTYPYDVSKTCAELITRAYARTYDLPAAVARCGNIYGGGDLNFSRLVPGTIRSLVLGRRPVIRSDGRHTRDYLYVEDAVRGYLLLAEALSEPAVCGEAFNFGTGTPVTVLEMVRLLRVLMGRLDLEPVVQGGAPAEIERQSLSAEKARRVLGWSPVYSLEEGLQETVAWYREHLSHRTLTGP